MTWPTVATYDALLLAAATRDAGGTGLDPASLAALAKAHLAVESNFVRTAYHFDGPDPALNASYGLLQVEGTTARRLGFTGGFNALYDPATNIDLGVRLMAQNLQGAEGSIDAAIAAYNEGLDRALADAAAGTPWRTTDPQYVGKVRDAFAHYSGDFAGTLDTTGDGGSSSSMTVTPAVIAGVAGLVIALLVWWSRRG